MRVSIRQAGFRPVLALVGTLGLLAAGCGLDKAEEPPVIGPSETGVSVQLTALPDILNADGVSTSVIQLVLRTSAGAPFSGKAVNFYLESGDGVLGPSASSTYVGPIQTGFVMATDKDGVANVVYVAGTGIGTVRVAVRPFGIDSNMAFYRTVEIFQQ
jgi:hypothetical protein